MGLARMLDKVASERNDIVTSRPVPRVRRDLREGKGERSGALMVSVSSPGFEKANKD